MGIDLNKFKADMKRELEITVDKAMKSISKSDKEKIGDAAVTEMKTLISKGISPIASVGRFEAYKWVGKANQLLKSAKGLSSNRRKSARAKASSIKANKYPYSAMKKFPQKRERPVNLELSGEFLKNLTSKATQTGVEIGFFDKKSQQKELGHREGANGQPQRPIIPDGNEQLSPSIYRRIVDTVTLVLRQKFRT